MIPFLIIMIFVCSVVFFLWGYSRGSDSAWKDAKETYDTSDYDEVFEFYD